MCGLISLSIVAWALGTALGYFLSDVLPEKILDILGISLYDLFYWDNYS